MMFANEAPGKTCTSSAQSSTAYTASTVKEGSLSAEPTARLGFHIQQKSVLMAFYARLRGCSQ